MLQEKPIIEVLMAVYNGAKYIDAQIDSIMQQTLPPTRLIIRDNCSEDQTFAIVAEKQKKFPKQIIWVPSQTNVGVVGNFAALIDLADSDYTLFSDCDDVWLPQKIQKTLKRMHALEQLYGKDVPLLVHTDLQVVNECLEVIHPSFCTYSYLKPQLPYTLAQQLGQNQVTGCTLMANRALINRARPLPKEIVMHDWWFALCAIAFGKISFLDEATLLYRQHGQNDTGAKKYGTLPHLKRMARISNLKKMWAQRALVVKQSQQFRERYASQLTEQQKELLEAFPRFNRSCFFYKAYLMYKYGFFKIGWQRNLWQIFGPSNWVTLFHVRTHST